MAVYIGSKHLVGSADIYLGSHVPTMYIGSFGTWPENITYEVSAITLHYSTSSHILADGSNYAYVTGTVTTKRGGTVIKVETGVTLTLTKVSGTSEMYVSNNKVYGNNRTTQTGDTRYILVSVSYGSLTSLSSYTISQQANSITGEAWGSVNIEDYSYSSVGAAGGTRYPYIEMQTQYGVYTYTSKATAETTNDNFTYKFTLVDGNGFTLEDKNTGEIRIASRGTTVGSARTSNPINFCATGNGGVESDTVSCTITQAANSVTSRTWNVPTIVTYEFTPTQIAASGGTSYVNLEAYQSGIYYYTSGEEGEVTEEDLTGEYSYSAVTGDLFSLIDSNGIMSASTKGTLITEITTSQPIYVVVEGHSLHGIEGEEPLTTTTSTTITQAANKLESQVFDFPTLSVSYPTAIAPGGGSVYPTKSASQNVINTYTSNATAQTSWSSFTWTFTYDGTGNFSLLSNTSGQMSATTLGTAVTQTETSSGTITAIVKGGDISKSASVQVYAKQAVNYITHTDWETPVIESFIYTVTIPASGGTSSPYAAITQYGTNYYASSSTARTGTTEVNRSYEYTASTGDRFSLRDSTNGMMTATTKGTSVEEVTYSQYIKLTATGKDSLVATATARVNQALNKAEGTVWQAPVISEFEYETIPAVGGTVEPALGIEAQVGITTYTSKATGRTYNSEFDISYFNDGAVGFTIDEESGLITAESMGTSVTERSTVVTVTVSGSGSTSVAQNTTVVQRGATYTIEWFAPSCTTFTYDSVPIPAGGGDAAVTVEAIQYGAKTYSTGQVVQLVNRDSFDYEFSYTSTGSGDLFSLLSETGGGMSASTKGTLVTGITTSGTITVKITGNGSETGSSTTKITQAANSLDTSTEYYSGNSGYTASVSLNDEDNIYASGGTATIVPSAYHTHYYKYKYTSGSYTDYRTYTVSDTYTLSLTENTGNRFSIDGTTLKHETMAKECTTDYATVKIVNNGNTSKTASTRTEGVTNTTSVTWYGITICGFTYDTFSAAGGTQEPENISFVQTGLKRYTSTASEGVTNYTFTYTYSMLSGNGFSLTDSDVGEITAEDRGTTTGNSRSSNIITIKVTGQSKTASATTTATQEANEIITTKKYNEGNSGYTASASWSADKLCASGGTATISASASHTYYYRYKYTSGNYTSYYSESKTDTPTLTLTTNGNNRFTFSNPTLTHSNMTTNIANDYAVITIKNSSYTTTLSSTTVINRVYGLESTSNPTISYSGTIPASGGTLSDAGTMGTIRYRYTSNSTGTTTPSSTYGTLSKFNTYTMDSSGGFSIGMSSGVITAETRGTVTGTTRTSSTITKASTHKWTPSSTYSSNEVSVTSYVYGSGVSQQYNYATEETETTGWDYLHGLPSIISYSGGTFSVIGERYYDLWSAYTSGAKSEVAHTFDDTTAQTVTSSVSWAIGDGGNLVVYSNGTSSQRGCTIYGIYDSFTASTTISQYRCAYTHTSYTASALTVTPSTFNWNVYGSGNTALCSCYTYYTTYRWIDGKDYYLSGGAYNGTDTKMYLANGSHFYILHYDSSYDEGYLLRDSSRSDGYGYNYVYPYEANTSTEDVEDTVQVYDASVTVTHTKYATPSITISPTTYSPSSAAGSTSITVTSNITGWSALSSNSSWLTVTKKSETSATASVTQNTGGTRTGYIYFQYASTTYATLTVTQTSAAYYMDWVYGGSAITPSCLVEFRDSVPTITDNGSNDHDYTVTVTSETAGSLYHEESGNTITFEYQDSSQYGIEYTVEIIESKESYHELSITFKVVFDG